MSKDLKLYTEELCSKWGFNDGDQISDFLFDLNPKLSLSLTNEQLDRLLIILVERYIIPELKKNYKNVEYCKEGLCHNPIRLRQLDDIEIDDRDCEKDYNLKPEYVIIPIKDILKIIKEIKG